MADVIDLLTSPGTTGRTLRALAWCAILSLAVVTASCLLFAAPAADDPVLECFVTVRNPGAVAEIGDAVPEEDLFSRADPFLREDGSPIRHYFLGDDCDGSFPSIQAAEDDWRVLVRQRIEELRRRRRSGERLRPLPGRLVRGRGDPRVRRGRRIDRVLSRRAAGPADRRADRALPRTTAGAEPSVPRDRVRRRTLPARRSTSATSRSASASTGP